MMTATSTLMTERHLPWYSASTSLVDCPQTAEGALEHAGLNWEVALKACRYDVYQNGKTTRMKSRALSVVRTDTWDEIGVVGQRYQTLSNAQSFRFLDELAGESGASFVAAGSQRGGARVFIVMKLHAGVRVLGHDEHEQYMFFMTSHDGSLSVTAKPTLVRVRCTNMFHTVLAARDTAIWKAQHLTNLEDKVADVVAVRNALNLAETGAEQFRQLAERLVTLHVVDGDGPDGFDALMRLGLPWSGSARDKLVDGVREVWQTSGTVDDATRGTAWGLLNATTEYLDHHRVYRTRESRFTNIIFTLGATIERNLTRGLSRRVA